MTWLDYRQIEDDALCSAYSQQRGKLIWGMRHEAAAAIIHLEGIGNNLEPSNFGEFRHEKDGTVLFLWRGRAVLRFRFQVSQTPGRGMDLMVDRLYLQGKT